ncbi:MAG TPA: DUF308 domain-containing protein [Candidatus Saccharimonadales bacterium]
MSTANKAEGGNQSALVLGGVATILFGLAAVFWPHETLLVVLYLFAAYVIVGGIVSIVSGISALGKNDAGFLHILLGFFELAIGVYFLRHPSVTFTTFVLLIGIVLAAQGVIGLITTYYDKSMEAKSQALAYFVSVVAIVAGVLIMFAKPASGVAFVWVLGVWALIVGTVKIAELSRTSK